MESPPRPLVPKSAAFDLSLVEAQTRCGRPTRPLKLCRGPTAREEEALVRSSARDLSRQPTIALALVAALLAAGVVAAPTSSSRANPLSDGETPVIAFATYRNGLSAIYEMGSDGSGRQELTTPQRGFIGQPAYSPDGSKIAYVCGRFELCVMNADGTDQGRLTTSGWPQRWEYVDHPSWSADGSKIAFASNAEGRFHVYVINADGTGVQRLPGTTWNDDDPAWSPDGAKIAFDRYRSWAVARNAIYVMNADGTHPRALTSMAKSDWGPSWSADGTKILFVRREGEYTHPFVMNVDGTGKTQLRKNYFCDDSRPAWSPTGSVLALERACDGRLGIAIDDFSRVVRITTPRHGFDLYPTWRPIGTGGTTVAALGPPSTAAGDALLVATYFYWERQIWADRSVTSSSVRFERRERADALSAVAALRAVQPDTNRGKLFRRNAIAAFRLDAAHNTEYLRSYEAEAHGKNRASRRHELAGDAFASRSDRKFVAADNVATLPY
jgi:Tol biopolymer transport system component